MGICSSCESTHVATAKLILEDGRLQEFSYPIKASYVLAKNPTTFICNSDEMEFDDIVSAVDDDEELQPGQLYFALPMSWLKHPLQAEEMAALAVKASSAMMKSGCGEKCGCRLESMSPMMFSAEKTRRGIAAEEGKSSGDRGLRKGGGVNGRRKFTAMLNGIPE